MADRRWNWNRRVRDGAGVVLNRPAIRRGSDNRCMKSAKRVCSRTRTNSCYPSRVHFCSARCFDVRVVLTTDRNRSGAACSSRCHVYAVDAVVMVVPVPVFDPSSVCAFDGVASNKVAEDSRRGRRVVRTARCSGKISRSCHRVLHAVWCRVCTAYQGKRPVWNFVVAKSEHVR